MGIWGKFKSKTKNIESIIYDLEDTGLLQEEVEAYEALSNQYEQSVNEMFDLSEIREKAERKANKATKKVEHIEKKLAKMREKHAPFARLKFSRVFFWSKEGRRYRALKRSLKNAKLKESFAIKTINTVDAKISAKENENKDIEKSIKELKKDLRENWYSHEDDIKFIRKYQENRDILINMYSPEEIQIIENCIEQLQTEGEMKNSQATKDFQDELQSVLKGEYNPDKDSIFREVAEEEAELNVETQEQEEAQDQNTPSEENSGMQSNEEEQDLDENVIEGQDENDIQNEKETNDNNKGKTLEEEKEYIEKLIKQEKDPKIKKEMQADLDKIEAELDSKKKDNAFRADMSSKENTAFVGSMISRDKLEKSLKNAKIKNPEEFLRLIGRKSIKLDKQQVVDISKGKKQNEEYLREGMSILERMTNEEYEPQTEAERLAKDFIKANPNVIKGTVEEDKEQQNNIKGQEGR